METYKFGKFEIELSAKFTNEYVDKFGNGEMGKFIVRVGYRGKSLQFCFYESVNDTKAGKTDLFGNDLVEAFNCFVGDVLLVIGNDWDRLEIENEVGEISNKTYLELKRSANSFLRLFESDDAFELREKVEEFMENYFSDRLLYQ